jgi:hypothetical protein
VFCGGFGVFDLGFARRHQPRFSRALDGGLAGEEDEHFLVRIGARQGDGNARFEFGDAGCYLEEALSD